VDAAQMCAGGRIAPVKELLQRRDIAWRLVHERSKSLFRGVVPAQL
jgi:hypothetical protein